MARNRVSDDGSFSIYTDRDERIFSAAEARAKIIEQTARRCAKCGQTMLSWPGRTVHFSCDPELPLAGKRCTCPSGCSDKFWGTGSVACAPECEPCKIMRGQPLRGKRTS